MKYSFVGDVRFESIFNLCIADLRACDSLVHLDRVYSILRGLLLSVNDDDKSLHRCVDDAYYKTLDEISGGFR